MQTKKFLRKYFAFIQNGLKEMMIYPLNLISRLFVYITRVLVYIFIYKYLIEVSPDGTLGGLTLVEASWSVALVQIVGQSSRFIHKEIKNDIKKLLSIGRR